MNLKELKERLNEQDREIKGEAEVAPPAPPGSPAWVRGEKSIEEEHGERLREDAAAMRLNIRGVGHLPLDRERARVELTEEAQGLARFSPRRHRWKKLADLDDRVATLERRWQELVDESAGLQAQRQEAEQAHLDALARWAVDGEQGPKPESQVASIDARLDELAVEVEALHRARGLVLQEKVDHVERHRDKLLKEAQQQAAQAERRYLNARDEIAAARADALEVRDLVEWIGTYPSERQAYGRPTALRLGLLGHLERVIGTEAIIEFGALLEAIGEDAKAISTRFNRPVLEVLGTAPPATPLTEAMWSTDPAYKEWAAAELERARQLAEYGDRRQLAAEARDFRPDPGDG